MQDFNINDEVWVKLTQRGLQILEEQHRDLSRRWGSEDKFTPPATDPDGYTNFQMWVLMQTFGPYIHMGGSIPFETTIRIP